MKGHATDEHVVQGTTTEVNRKGNSVADEVADMGVRVHGEATYELARLYTARHQSYTKLMRDVAIHIVEAHMIHRELLRIAEAKEKAQQGGGQKLYAYVPLEYPRGVHACDSRTVRCFTMITNLPALTKAHPNIIYAQRFLQSLQVQASTQSIAGITWIQLYILYRLAGFPKPLANPACPALVKSSLLKQLEQFKANIRCVVSKVMHEEDAKLFRPEQKHRKQFQALAISGVHPSIMCNVHLCEDGRKLVDRQLIKLSRRISSIALSSFLTGGKNLPTVKLDLKGKASWDDSMPTLTSLQERCQALVPEPVLIHEHSDEAYYKMHTITCPSCGHMNIAQEKQLQQTNLELKIKCCSCCKLWASVGWKCCCGVRWHTCFRHARKAHTRVEGKRAEITRNKSNKASKRKLENASLDEILDDDLRLESKHARCHQYDGIIDLGASSPQTIRLGMLPESLKLRFPNVASACASDR